MFAFSVSKYMHQLKSKKVKKKTTTTTTMVITRESQHIL